MLLPTIHQYPETVEVRLLLSATYIHQGYLHAWKNTARDRL